MHHFSSSTFYINIYKKEEIRFCTLSVSLIHHRGCAFGLVNTLATAIATVPPATANNMYATVKAPRSNVLRPRELFGLPSSPITIKSLSLFSSSSKGEGMTTESEPVPNDAPTAILSQNSYVAQMNGIIPMMNAK